MALVTMTISSICVGDAGCDNVREANHNDGRPKPIPAEYLIYDEKASPRLMASPHIGGESMAIT